MENSLKGLILAAGTIITCLVISLGFFIAKEAKASAENGANQIGKLNAEFFEGDKVIYNGTQVSGSEVINLIRKFEKEKISLIIQTNRSLIPYFYSYNESTGTLVMTGDMDYDPSIDVDDPNYINPTARFYGSIQRDKNGSICVLRFVQE